MEQFNYRLDYLRELESESIFIIREVAAQFENPVILFSGGKDSVVMLHVAVRAFAPAKLPFAIMHVDTGHNFPEVIEFRDAKLGIIVSSFLVPAFLQGGVAHGWQPAWQALGAP